MKRIFYVFLVSILFSNTVKSQDFIDLNLVVIVNEEIDASSVSVKLKYSLKDGNIKNVNARYVPGSLKVKKVDFNEIKKDSVKNIIIEICNTNICKENISYSFFIIEDLRFSLLEYDFFILKIYDTELKQYKSIYKPIENKKFAYEYDSPAGSMRRGQMKRTKKQKECD